MSQHLWVVSHQQEHCWLKSYTYFRPCFSGCFTFADGTISFKMANEIWQNLLGVSKVKHWVLYNSSDPSSRLIVPTMPAVVVINLDLNNGFLIGHPLVNELSIKPELSTSEWFRATAFAFQHPQATTYISRFALGPLHAHHKYHYSPK